MILKRKIKGYQSNSFEFLEVSPTSFLVYEPVPKSGSRHSKRAEQKGSRGLFVQDLRFAYSNLFSVTGSSCQSAAADRENDEDQSLKELAGVHSFAYY